MENKQEHVQHVKKVSDVNGLDIAEKKLDQKMEKFMKNWWAEKFMNMKFIKDLLGSRAMKDVNEKIIPYLKILFTIVWWISIVAGIIWIFSFLVSLSWLGFVFSFWFGIGLRVVIYILLALGFSCLTLLSGIWMIRFKRWALTVIFWGFVISLATFIISFIPSGFYVASRYGTFWSSLLNLLITFVFLLLVFKNKEMFKN